MSSNENLPPTVIMKLMKEIQSLVKDPPEGIAVSFQEDDLSNIQADICGPEGTPFEGGVFRIKLVIGADFPASPPKGYCMTKIFHPNVSKTGEICVNTLKKDWEPKLGIKHVLLVVRCLLIVPNPASALNEEAGKLLLENYDEFAKRAKMWTRIHAKPKTTAGTPSKSKATDETKETKSQDLTKKAKTTVTSGTTGKETSTTSTTATTATTTTTTSVPKEKVVAKKKALKRL